MARSLFLPALLLFNAPSAVAHATPLTPQERAALSRGEIITRVARLAKNTGRSEAIGVIDAAPKQVFSVIADVTHYKALFERIVESRVVARRAGSYDFYYVIDMPWPLSDHRCVTRNVHKIDDKAQRYERRWRLIKGTFHRNEGSWEVSPFAKGKALVVYTALVEPKTAAPSFIVRYVAKKALPKAIEALRRRVATLLAKGRL